MRKLLNIFFILIVLCTLGNNVFAQDDLQFDDFKKVAQAGFKFLSIDVGTRNTAMAGAAITNEGDPVSLFWNPAGIVSMEKKAFYAGYTKWIADMNQTAVSAVFPVSSINTFGVSFSMFNYGDFNETIIADYGVTSREVYTIGYVDLGTFSMSSYAVGLTYGRSLTNRFHVALTAKYAHEDLYVMDKGVMAFDFGTIYIAGIHDIKIAATMQHFAFEQPKYLEEDFMLPLTFHVGFSIDALSLSGYGSENSKLILAINGAKPRDYSERVHLGAEYWFKNQFALRGGYRFNYDMEGLTAGFGLKYKGFEFGYSFSDFDSRLSNVSRFDISFYL